MAGYHQSMGKRGHIGDIPGGQAPRTNQLAEEPAGYNRRRKTGRRTWRPANWSCMAHPGTGKSLSMAFYAGQIIRDPAMANPTMVVITDRNDLDEQLFGTFSRCKDLLRQTRYRRKPREPPRKTSRFLPEASYLRRSRSLCPMKRAISIRGCRIGKISW